jgi:hypothetical protein
MSVFLEGKMMKNASVVTILVIILCALVFCLAGCGFFAQPGETEAEGARRHQRNLTINNQGLMRDLDTAFLWDEPSKTTELKID